MGYPDEDPPLRDRLPLEAVVHREIYEEYSAEKIDRIYKEREESEETMELLRINNKKTLAQIFTDNRYTKADNELFSDRFLRVIRQQGFLD